MIESAAHELSEDIMLDAVYAGHEAIKELCACKMNRLSLWKREG